MERFYKYAVHCILTFVFVFATLKLFAQGIAGTTSANGVNVIYQDGFNSSSLYTSTAPYPTDKWCRTSTQFSISNIAWITGVPGYETGTTHSMQVGTTVNGYLWSPVISLPAGKKLFARIIHRSGSPNMTSGQFLYGVGFDANNDLVADAGTAFSVTMTGTSPYTGGTTQSDWGAGFFFPTFNHGVKNIFIDLTPYAGQSGRVGIRMQNISGGLSSNTFLDWFVVGTVPDNDLCANAISLSNGVNGGTNGYYNTTASGLRPFANATGTPGNNQGGSVVYVGSGNDGLATIPKDAGNLYDGYQPSSPGPFSANGSTVENSIWFKFITPPDPLVCGQAANAPLSVKITIRNLSGASALTNIPSTLQVRAFNSSVCGSSAAASGIALNTMQSLGNNGTFTLNGLSYNTTYYILIDSSFGNDCRFNIETETLINGTTQPTNPCTILPITLKDFTATPEEDGTVSLNWATLSERNNDFFTVERSTDGVNYVEIHKQAGAGNSTTEQVYGAVDFLPEAGLNYYRLKQTDFDGNFEYFDPVAVNVIPSMLNMTLIPNPTSREASVLLSSRTRQHIQLQVYDITGKFLFQVEDYINEGNTSFSLPSEKWNSGTYSVRVVTDKETLTEKLIVNL